MFKIEENNDLFRIYESNYTLFAIGDIHGNFNVFKKYIKRYEITKAIFIICGDCGFGFSSREGDENDLVRLNRLLKETDCYIICVRGNHDKPSFFNSKERFVMSNIICVPDYAIISSFINDDFNSLPLDNILCVGGGISIDRLQRKILYEDKINNFLKYHPNGDITKVRELYWEDEKPVYNEEKLNEIIKDGLLISCVITHTAPSFVEPHEKHGIQHFLLEDKNLSKDLDYERNVMDNIFNFLKDKQGNILEKWFYGHFHSTHISMYNGVSFNMLGIEVMTEINTIGQKSKTV